MVNGILVRKKWAAYLVKGGIYMPTLEPDISGVDLLMRQAVTVETDMSKTRERKWVVDAVVARLEGSAAVQVDEPSLGHGRFSLRTGGAEYSVLATHFFHVWMCELSKNKINSNRTGSRRTAKLRRCFGIKPNPKSLLALRLRTKDWVNISAASELDRHGASSPSCLSVP